MTADCIHTPYSLNRKGYGDCKFNGVHVNHHRAVYCEANNKTLEDIEGLQVMHTCDNRWCIQPKHLVLGTNQDNVDDKMSKGRHVGGGLLAISDPETIARVREQKTNGAPVHWIAKQHRVSKRAIENIINRVGRYANL